MILTTELNYCNNSYHMKPSRTIVALQIVSIHAFLCECTVVKSGRSNWFDFSGA